MKRNISILSALLCIAFLFTSCLNPTQSESGKKSNTGNGGTGGGGGYWSAPAGESESGKDSDSGDGEEELPASIGYKDFTFDIEKEAVKPTPTISIAGLNTENGDATLATLKLPETGGPWIAALDDGDTEENTKTYNMTARINPSVVTLELKFKVIIDGNTNEASVLLRKGETLEFGLYSIKLVFKGANDKVIRKTLTFEAAKTPAPFTKAPEVWPEITGIETNKLAVKWEAPSGAETFNIYYGKTDNFEAATLGKSKITATSSEITDLPNGETYYVWVEAVNSGGETLSESVSRKTSECLPEFFYKYIEPETRRIMYSWDSFYGNGGNGGLDFYRITPSADADNPDTPDIDETKPRMSYGGKESGTGAGWTAEICYFDVFPEEGRPDGTRVGKWGESLLVQDEETMEWKESPAGVFIVKYDNPPGERIYQGVYYYGQGAIQTAENAFGPNGVSAVGLEICYFGNSYGAGNPETATLVEAIDRFTLANMSRYIAFVAIPWYRCYGYDNIEGSQQVAPE
jgi:hypothetical protein